jgi:hypothetical protein
LKNHWHALGFKSAMNRILLIKKLNGMKTVLSFITIAAVVTACNSNPQTTPQTLPVPGAVVMHKDTTGFAEFQAWKAYQADKAVTESSNEAAAAAKPVRKYASAKPVKAKAKPTVTKSETLNTEGAYPAKAPQRKGWSKAAKGAAIGGASGAVIGAVVHKKNRVLGGVVGGVVGAGAGYGIGRTMDKKDGRYFVGQ